MIRPRGLELKNNIGAWVTLWSIVLWRVLLRWTKIAPMKKAVSPEEMIESRESAVN